MARPGFPLHPAHRPPPAAPSLPPVAAASPFQVKGTTPDRTPPVDTRLYATIVVCGIAVCAGLLAVVFAAVGAGPSMADDARFGPEPGPATPYVLPEDTGGWDEDMDEEDEPVHGHGASSSDTPKPVAVVASPSAVSSGGALTVHLPDPRGITSIAVSCPSGFSGRSVYGRSPYVIPGVPGERCTLWFRGSSPYKFVGVSGGQSLTCGFASNVAQCE